MVPSYMSTFIYYYDLVILTDPSTYLLSCVISSASRRHPFLLNAMFTSLVSMSSLNWKFLLTHKTRKIWIKLYYYKWVGHFCRKAYIVLWHIMLVTQTDWFEYIDFAAIKTVEALMSFRQNLRIWLEMLQKCQKWTLSVLNIILRQFL